MAMLLSLLLCFGSSCCDDSFMSDTIINNVVQDPQTGRIYLGAINNIYQLNYDLQKESSAVTGPRHDNPQCTPPITAQCTDAKDMDNINKLLLVNSANGTLIVCGSLFRGICSLVNLSSVDKPLYYSDTKGEKTYVASTEESVTVVGVISYFIDAHTNANLSVFLVGKGYGSSDSSKLISTRLLQEHREMDVFENMVEASTVQASPFVQRYLHDFRHAFKDNGYIYFLFSRTPGTSDSRKITFIARLCENDHHYYSYTELQKIIPSNPNDKVLFAVFSVDEDGGHSALCMYPLSSINTRLEEVIESCYVGEVLEDEKPKTVYSPYISKTEAICRTKRDGYKCGAEFLPSPLASKPEYALAVKPIFTRNDMLTAVAVAVENEHTVAFLGTSGADVLKVSPIPGSVKANAVWLIAHVCLLCSFSCTRKKDCRKAEGENAWLWSPKQTCVTIQSFVPPNISCKKTERTQVLKHNTFINTHTVIWSAVISNPNLLRIDSRLIFTDLKITVNDGVEVASSEFEFYNCAAVVKRSENTPCIACVTSKWGCQWNIQDHTCSDRDDTVKGDHIIQHMQDDRCPQFEIPEPLLIPVGIKTPIQFQGKNLDEYWVKCMHYFLLFEGFEVSMLQSYSSYYVSLTLPLLLCSHIDLFLEFEHQPIWHSQLLMVLYNCSVRREDCSLCKNADQKYNCVWCDTTKSCIYRDLCNQELKQCPPPKITDIVPRYGPMKGQISVTIKGSNLGIKQEDIKRITIAGVPCTHQPERYSVSTRYSMTRSLVGPVEVEVEGGRTGQSQVLFTYRDPVPKAVSPSKGPAAGGTVITITGQDLDTASIDDISITVDRELTFGQEITCMTGLYKGQKIPSDKLPVIVKYGKDTSIEVSGFEYSTNPKVTDYTPRASFSKAMTAKEAQAFVGDVSCAVTILEDDKLGYGIIFGNGEWNVGSVRFERKYEVPLYIIIPAVLIPMVLFIAVSIYCYRRKSQQAEREYEKIKNDLANLEESVRDRCKKEFTDLMIEMEDHTSDLNEARIPFLDYKNYTNRVFFLPSKDGANDVMITGKLDIPESRRAIVDQALNQFSNLLNSKTFLINFIRTLEGRQEFNARNKVYFASLLMVALHGKLEYYTDIMRTLLLELMEEYVHSKNPKLMLRRSETVVERMLCNWMSICLYQFLKDSAGEPLYKLFKAIKHQVEKGPVDAKMKKAHNTLNDTGLLGDDVQYTVLTLQVLVHGEGPDVTPVKVLNCDSISQVKEKIIEQVYRNLPYSQRPTVDSVALEWRPGSTGQILSDLDLTSQKEGRWKRINTLAHYNVRNGATLVLSRVLHTQQSFYQNQDNHEERNYLLEDDKVFHLVRPADELDEVKSKRGSMKDKATTKAITEIYLTRLLSMKGTLQQFVDDFFRSVLCSGTVVPPAVKYFFDFLDEQAQKHDNVDEETIHIWKTNSLPLRFWVNILKNPHFIVDVHVTEVVDASLSVIAQTFMDACTKTEHKLTRESPSNKLLYAKEISTYKKMVDDYYKGIRQMVPVSDQDMNTHLAEVSRSHTDKLNTQVALHQLYQYASKYYDGIISSLEDDPAAQSKQLTLRLQQIAAALENKVTDL
uniref:Plexin-B2-like n=1 Tax=Sinocyclocheilus rhinocerous TaxID=307959 RepID=A0A673L8G4_9TELE